MAPLYSGNIFHFTRSGVFRIEIDLYYLKLRNWELGILWNHKLFSILNKTNESYNSRGKNEKYIFWLSQNYPNITLLHMNN